MDTIIAEFIQHAPHLYQLLCQLGQGQCQSESVDMQKSTQAIMCLCALMKGRSKMVLGMLHLC